MKLGVESLDRTTLLIPEGRLDFAAAAEFQRQVDLAFAGGGVPPSRLIIDCAGLAYVSSAGLRVLLLAARTAQRAKVGFALCALQPAVREVFELSGFSQIMVVYADRAAALAQLKSRA